MATKEPEQWITVNGRHIPIGAGESKQDAINRALKNKDEDTKQRQIKQNEQEANRLNNSQRIAELEKQLQTAKGLIAKDNIKEEIEMIKAGWKGTLKEWKEKRNAELRKEREKNERLAKAKREEERRQAENKKAEEKKQLEHELKTQPKDKVQQFKLIQKTNPMNDDYHVGIRKPSDIKTWKEAVNDSKKDDAFVWGDFSRKDAEKALQDGKITIYSSYPIKQGTFVSTSKIQSEQYAGGTGSKVYSKTVSLKDVAWINGDEGQFAELKKK